MSVRGFPKHGRGGHCAGTRSKDSTKSKHTHKSRKSKKSKKSRKTRGGW